MKMASQKVHPAVLQSFFQDLNILMYVFAPEKHYALLDEIFA